MVDEAGDVARSHGQVVSQLAQRHVAATEQAEEDAHPALAEVVLGAPPLLQQVKCAAGVTKGGQRLNRGQVDLEWIKKLAKALDIETAIRVALDFAQRGSLGELHFRVMHFV